MSELTLPKSATYSWINYTGLCFLLVSFFILWQFKTNVTLTISICVLAYALPILILETFYVKTSHAPLSSSISFTKDNTARVLYKLIALYFTLFLVLFAYWLFPEYHKPVYQPFWPFFKYVVSFVLVVSIPYFIYVDAKLNDPYDAYWLLGKLLCLDNRDIPNSMNKKYLLSQHFLGWVVKAYFLPIMFVMLWGFIDVLYRINFDLIMVDIRVFFTVMVCILFGIDLLVGVTGYLFTLKLFDSHIRSADSTFFGWVICIICYMPFVDLLLDLYFAMIQDQSLWALWITNQTMQWIWCILVLAFLSIYAAATVAFGIRFSNLTHRGILSCGPYRYSKHPAYLSKVLFWWFSTMPFMYFIKDPRLGVKAITFLGGVSLIYYFRAKTEEAHLSKDPTYVQYAKWINEHGILAKIAKGLSFTFK